MKPVGKSPQAALVGLETEVLRVWLENSRRLKKAYQSSPAAKQDIETAARLAVHAAHVAELKYRAQGMQQHEAEEFTRPVMWTPPTWPTTTPSRTRTPEGRPSDTSPSDRPQN